MANTTNFNWETPDNTDLVKDGAAAIRTLGNSIDTSFVDLKGGTTGQVLAKASNTDLDFTWTDGGDITAVVAGTGLSGGGTSGSVTLTNTVATTFDSAGDLVYGTGADTFTKLGIGTAGQVLKVNSGATAPEWGAVSASANWSLVNAGGTALTGATTVTVSGISAADKIMVLVEGASSASSTFISVRFNADTGTSYYQYGVNMEWTSAYSAAIGGNLGSALDRIRLGLMSNSTSSAVSGYVLVSGANTSGKKVFNCAGSGSPFSSNSQQSYITGGYYDSSSTISSVSIVSSSGNLDAGTVYVYTSA